MGKVRNFISSASHSRTLSVLVILILFAAVPLTVLVAQKQQQTQQNAEEPACPPGYQCGNGVQLSPSEVAALNAMAQSQAHGNVITDPKIINTLTTDTKIITALAPGVSIVPTEDGTGVVIVAPPSAGGSTATTTESSPQPTGDTAAQTTGPYDYCTATSTCVYLAVPYPDGRTGYINQFTGTSYTPDQVNKIPGGVPKSTTTFDPTLLNQGPIINNGSNPIYPISGGPANNITIPQDPTTLKNNTLCAHQTAYCSGAEICVDQMVPLPNNPALSSCKTDCVACGNGQSCQATPDGKTSCGQSSLICRAVVNPVPFDKQPVSFTATGGSGNYSWQLPNGNPANTTGIVAATTYAKEGKYTAALTDTLGKSATCDVTVGNGIVINFAIGIDGIGSAGDKISPRVSKFVVPNSTKQRVQATVHVSDNKTDVSGGTISTPLTYNTTSGLYEGQAIIPSSITGAHDIRVEIPAHLIKKFGTTQGLTTGQTLTGNLPSGDINGDKTIDVLDYRILVGCWFPNKSNGQSVCGAYQQESDLNGDGTVDQLDYNLLLREFGQSGD